MFRLRSRSFTPLGTGLRRRSVFRPVIWLALIVTGLLSFWPRTHHSTRADDPVSMEQVATEGATPHETADHEHGSAHPTRNGHAAEAQDSGGASHDDPVTPLLLAIVIILLLARLFGDLFERRGLPAVLGELVIGVILGNMALLTGWTGLEFLKAPMHVHVGHDLEELERLEAEGRAENQARIEELREEILSVEPYSVGAILSMLAGIGVVLLLFEVGLESKVEDMVAVGASALIVAILGVVAPILLGFAVGMIFLPDEGWQVQIFLGATLCATSVGITARVLKDMGRSQQRESRIILGAAVIDDVLGLLVLAVVAGVIQQGADFRLSGLLLIIAKSLGFLAVAVFFGSRYFAKPLFDFATTLRGHGLLVTTALVICFGMAWLAGLVGLAPIVGAFAAGLILENAHYEELGNREDTHLEHAMQPLVALLVPIFFVQMGIMVDLSSFADPSVWGLATGLTLAAVLGKQVCSLGVMEPGVDRLSVGIGMIPRGEVGLIFASVGKGLNTPNLTVMTDGTYSAIVVMVIMTTMITPPVLKWSMSRRGPLPPEETGGSRPSTLH